MRNSIRRFSNVLLVLNLFATLAVSQTKTNIAVADLAGQGIDASTAAIISDRLRSELFTTGTVYGLRTITDAGDSQRARLPAGRLHIRPVCD